MAIGHKLLGALLLKKDVAAFYNAKLADSYFVADELSVFKFIQDHLLKHGALPDISTAQESFGEFGDIVEPPSFYLGKVEERFGFSTFNSSLQTCAGLLKEKDISAIVTEFESATSKVKNSGSRFNILDYAKDGAQLFKQLHAATFYGDNGIKLGWPSLDTTTEGMVAGDIFSIVGRPASGKTFLDLWVAYWAYLKQERNVLFLSMEMSIPAITQRMTAIITKANMTDLKMGKLSTQKMVDIDNTITSLDSMNNRLWIVDGSLRSTVGDIAALVHQFKPDLVVVDGAYLLKHENKRLDRYTRVAENIEHMKQLAEQNKIPMLLSYQFSREASKKKTKGEAAGLEDIAYSDAIGQISSVVLGLMQPESTETLNERVVSLLKGRNGEQGTFNIKWDFTNVDFSEVSPPDPEHEAENSYADEDYND